MGAAIVRGHNLDVLALPAAIWLLVLDADVGEVDLVIEVRQVVFVRPFANPIRRAIGMAIVVVMVLVAFVEPALVLVLQLVVEDDALDARTAVQEAVLGLFLRAIDPEVVFELPFAPQAVSLTKDGRSLLESHRDHDHEHAQTFYSGACSRYPKARVVTISLNRATMGL